MITTFENRWVLNIYVIVLRHIFDTMYKGKQQVEIYMWALHHELVLFIKSRDFFAMYQRMKLKGAYWAVPRIDAYLYIFILIDTYWYIFIDIDAYQHIDTYVFIFKKIDTYSYIFIPIYTHLYIITHIDAYWCILIDIDTYWYILIHIVSYAICISSIVLMTGMILLWVQSIVL